MEIEDIPQPAKMETEVMLRCAHCKRPLYVETIVEERDEHGVLVETGRHHEGNSHPTCNCRKEQ